MAYRLKGELINYTKRGNPLKNHLKLEPVGIGKFLVCSTMVEELASLNLLRDLTHYDEEEMMIHRSMLSEIPTCIMSGKVVLDANVHWCNTFKIKSKFDIVNKTTRVIQGPMTEARTVNRLMETLLVRKEKFKGTLTNYTMDGMRTTNLRAFNSCLSCSNCSLVGISCFDL